MERPGSNGKLVKDNQRNSQNKNANGTYPATCPMIAIGFSGLCSKNVSHLNCSAGPMDVNCAAVGRTFTMASIPLMKILSNP